MSHSNSSSPQKITGLCGQVVRGDYGDGSKSEHKALFIQTATGRLLLRRKTGPVMGDEELLKYLGKQVKCDGFIVGSSLLAEVISLVE